MNFLASENITNITRLKTLSQVYTFENVVWIVIMEVCLVMWHVVPIYI